MEGRLKPEDITEIVERVDKAIRPYLREIMATEILAIRAEVRKQILGLAKEDIREVIRRAVEDGVCVRVKLNDDSKTS